MKKMQLIVCCLAALISFSVRGGEAEKMGGLLVHPNSVDTAVVARASQYVDLNYDCSVRTKSVPEKWFRVEPETLLQNAKKLMNEDDLCAVVWSPAGYGSMATDVCSRAVCVIDMSELAEQMPENEDEQAKVFAGRLERRTMAAVGKFMGLEQCPWPRCVMFPATNLVELDVIGRNPCPPCQGKLEKLRLTVPDRQPAE